MIVNFRVPYTMHCYDIDIKSYLWPWTMEDWDNLHGYVIRVYLLSDEVIGFYSFKVEKGTMMISKLCVHPDFRHLGVGTKMHDDLLKMAKTYKKILRMMLHEDNKNRDFLIKRDWKAVSIERELFPDGSDGYLFEREII